MIRPFLMTAVALGTLGSVATSEAQSGVEAIVTSAPTVDLDGFTTFTITLETTDGSDIGAVDFGTSTFGFFGALNQVNPGGVGTVFADSNGLFSLVGADVSQDSQFLFALTDVTLSPGSSFESASSLGAAFDIAPASEAASIALAQLVIPDDALVTFSGNVAVSGESFEVSGVIPEPGTAILFASASGLGLLRRRRPAGH